MFITFKINNKIEPRFQNILTLAFVGDAVFELLVRGRLSCERAVGVNKLHGKSVQYVCSKSQSKFVDIIFDKLTDDEVYIYKRGRNNTSANIPKNSNMSDYRRATGLEALFGFLYLNEKHERINEIFELLWGFV